MIWLRKIILATLLTSLFLLVACSPANEEEAESTAEGSGEPTAVAETKPSPTAEMESTAVPIEEISPGEAPNSSPDQDALREKYAEYEIVNLLPRDAIPSIDDPEFVSVTEADEAYDPDELIIGVELNEQPRAYSVPLLSNHEIVNDEIDGIHFAVTW